MVGACMAGGCAWQGVCVARGHAWGVCVAGGMHGKGNMHGGAMCGRGHAWQGACMVGGVHGRGHAWQGACMAGGMHGEGCMAGDVHAMHAPQHYEIWSVNARAVRILLECILVLIEIPSTLTKPSQCQAQGVLYLHH